MDWLSVIGDVVGRSSDVVGLAGGTLGVASLIGARRALKKADAETDAMWSLLRKFEEARRAGRGNVFCVDVGSPEHKLAEKAVDKGILKREPIQLGCYSFRSPPDDC